jgi:mono/diheme cytochrome c family protein
MGRAGRVWGFLGLAATAGLGGSAPGQAADPEFEAQARPVLAAYCIGCHGPKKQKAKVDLSIAKGEADLALAQDLWLAALQQLKTRAMPPEEEKQPSDAERAGLVAWIEGALDRIDARAPRDPGRVTVRRLNRAEYNNSVRDLVGIDLRPADDFPADDVSEGFDTLGDVLALPPLLFEKYVDAAERILDRALVAEGPVEILERRIEAETLSKEAADGAVELSFDRELQTTLKVSAAGRYEVRVRGRQERSPDGKAILAVTADGQDLALVDVREEGVFAASIPLQAGEHRLAFRHTPPKAYAKEEKVPDTRLRLDWIEIAGSEQALSHRRIFGSDTEARPIVTRFASRAFRRPLEAGEAERLLKPFEAGMKEGRGFVRSVRRALWAVLVSPHFLFRVERDSADRDAAGHVRLSDLELASRLSYFLWSTMPDATLLELASKGRLRDPETLRAQARRMLADPRARALTDNFAMQWLGLRRFEQAQPDRDLFRGFNENLRRAMVDEAWHFFAGLVREDRSLVELIDADYTWLNETLARHYGVKDVKGEAMRRVPLADRTRGGVITMAAILTLTSYPTRTSAVKRGKWILDEILGAPPAPPPPNVPELDEATKSRPDAKELTLRQRLEVHRADPACHGCHKRMDVLGLGLENFDAIGRWREKEGSRRIDASGTLPTGESFASPAELKGILTASRDDFSRALAEKLFVYALGRPLERSDRRELKAAVEELRRNGYRISALVEAVTTSYPFRHRRAAPREETR